VIPLNTISKVIEVNNMKNHRWVFAVEQSTDSRIYYFEANNEADRKEWMDEITQRMGKKTEKGEQTDGGDQYDLTGFDGGLKDFFQQLFFEINYPKSNLVVNELFRIRIHVSNKASREPVHDHKGKLEVMINMPNGQTAEIEPIKGTTPGVWVAMFTPLMDGRHACNVRFLGKYIQHRTAVLHVSKGKKFGFL
jgi:hypothetical protein